MADSIVDAIAKIVAVLVSDICPDDLHKEEKSSNIPVNTKEQPAQTIKDVMKKNIESAVYSGVMHIFVRNKTKKERPVMTYKWKGEDVYFEYAESGEVIRICGDTKKQLLNVLNGGEERNFKKYELVI